MSETDRARDEALKAYEKGLYATDDDASCGFRRGWDAGLAANPPASTPWVKITDVESLPKEEGKYLWQFRKTKDFVTQYFYRSDAQWFINGFVAYQPITPFAQTPATDNGGENER